MESNASEAEFVSVSKVDVMTDARKAKLQLEDEKWEKFYKKETAWREKLKKEGKSEHYIYAGDRKALASNDGIDSEFLLDLIDPLLNDICANNRDRVKSAWYQNRED